MKNVYKFVNWEIPPLEELADTFAYKIMEKLNNNEKLTREEKNDLCCRFNDLCCGFVCNGLVRIQGWCFNFRPYLKYFVAKDKYGDWREYYAFDKTSLREQGKNNCLYFTKIIEIQ